MKIQQLALTVGLTIVGLGMNITSAQGATFDYSWQGSNGYSATGSFTTKDNAPTSFTEVASSTTPYSTQYLQSLSLSVFRPSNTLLDSGASVANGTSSDPFLFLSFNGQTNTITGIDTSTQFPGNKDTYYFLSNSVDPSGTVVGFGNTTFNLFQFTQSTNTTSFLGSATSIQANAVPEPSEVLGILALGGLGLAYKFNRSSLVKKLATKSTLTN